LRLPVVVAVAIVLAFALACKSEESAISGRAVVGSVPWPATEEARYRLLDGDDELGTGVLTIEAGGERTTFRQTFESEDFDDQTTAVADSETLEPFSTARVIDGPEGERRWEVAYENGTAVVSQRSDEDEREDRLSVPANSYESWTDVFLWRTIEFREGYETTYVDVLTATLAKPQVISQALKVSGKEKVEVPAGEFEAWRLEISSDDGDQTAWYADTAERPLVRYDNGSLVFELVSLD
jgi:predicted acyl esterase